MIENPAVSLFAAFGSFAMLLLVDFGGPMRDRLRDQAAFAATGAAFICVGTLAVALGVAGRRGDGAGRVRRALRRAW